MNRWGEHSLEALLTCTTDVQWVLSKVAERVNLTVIEGHRNEERQNSLYPEYTKLRWPDGKHNLFPSKAVDVRPWPNVANNIKLCSALGYIAGLAVEIGAQRGLIVRWGGDWDGDGDVTDQTFDDLFHLEISRGENYTPLTDADLDWLRGLGLGTVVSPDDL